MPKERNEYNKTGSFAAHARKILRRSPIVIELTSHDLAYRELKGLPQESGNAKMIFDHGCKSLDGNDIE